MVPLLVSLCVLLGATVAVLAWRLVRAHGRDNLVRSQLQAEFAEERRSLVAERDAMLDTLTDAFLLIDSVGLIRFANVPARSLFRGREILDRRYEEIFLDGRLAAPVREAIEIRERVTRELILPQQASPRGPEEQRGETAWVIDAGPLASDSPGDLTRVLIRDTTAEHQTEQIRKDFVANASHELRTPLSIINGYLENLIEDSGFDDPEAATRILKTMRKHAERIARIVEGMLVISRLESGEAGSLNLEPFRIEACVQDVLERLESVIAAQGATINLQMGEPGLTIVGDRFYWTQVLFNLIENALKQNPRLLVKISIGCRRTSDGGLRLWVADDGVGIPSGDLPFIFRRFYRVEKHHSQGGIKGTGLGLSLVKRAIEAHRGEITVTSTPGRETRFEMILPPAAVLEEGSEREQENAGTT